MGYKPGILLGQITKTSGFEGAVLVRLEKKFTDDIPELESVFVEADGRPVPFLLEWSEYQGADTLKLKFDGYDSPQKVEEFKGCRVYLTGAAGEQQEDSDFSMLTGYSVLNQINKILGTVKEVIINPGQLLLSIESLSGDEILIPFHEDLIIQIDKQKEIIIMDVPEGLLDINF